MLAIGAKSPASVTKTEIPIKLRVLLLLSEIEKNSVKFMFETLDCPAVNISVAISYNLMIRIFTKWLNTGCLIVKVQKKLSRQGSSLKAKACGKIFS